MIDLQATDLSDDDLERLDTSLMALEDAMGIDEAHGYLTALLVLNKMPDETEWLTAVLDEQDINQFGPESELLLRMKANIQHALENHQVFEPLYIEVDDEDITYLDYSGWCHGFMYGLSLQDIDWHDLNDTVKDLIDPISRLSLSEDEDEADDFSDDEYAEMIEMLPGSIAALYQYWHNS